MLSFITSSPCHASTYLKNKIYETEFKWITISILGKKNELGDIYTIMVDEKKNIACA